MSDLVLGRGGVHPVDEMLPTSKLATLGMQHVLVMYAGAVAVPLIIGRALKLSPQEVSMLISADLFCCGLVTLIQAWGATQWFRYSFAGDDGRDVRRSRTHGGHGKLDPGCRRCPSDFWLDHWCRADRDLDRTPG
jgi:hypothetical protein